MRYLLSIVLLVVSLAANAGAKTMRAYLGYWVGYPIEEMLEVWGLPTEEKTVVGHTAVIWRVDKGGRMNQYGVYRPLWCAVTVEYNSQKIITRVQFKGNVCSSLIHKKSVPPTNQEQTRAKEREMLDASPPFGGNGGPANQDMR